jgi:hypothetical protein
MILCSETEIFVDICASRNAHSLRTRFGNGGTDGQAIEPVDFRFGSWDD